MSPSIEYDEASAAYAWDEFEQEFDLVCAPFVEVRHLKIGAGGRLPHHLHRLYSRVRLDRTVASDRHHAPRIQKVARLAEIATGEPITPGDFDRSIIKALRAEGRVAEANYIEKAVALLPRPKKLTTRKERAEAKRLCVPHDRCGTSQKLREGSGLAFGGGHGDVAGSMIFHWVVLCSCGSCDQSQCGDCLKDLRFDGRSLI